MSEPVKVLYERDAQRGGASATDSLRHVLRDIQEQSGPTLASFKAQAGEAAKEAKSTVAALASEARDRFADVVDQQKAVGADQVAGVARAAQAAAADLEKTSPQLARFVKSAADGVEQVAGTIRASDVSDVIASITDFGRRRPVAFFGGAVAAGFLLARFLKSEVPKA